jgi:hypothetical protein
MEKKKNVGRRKKKNIKEKKWRRKDCYNNKKTKQNKK